MVTQLWSSNKSYLIWEGQAVKDAVERFAVGKQRALVVVSQSFVPVGILWAQAVMEFLAAGGSGTESIDGLVDSQLLLLQQDGELPEPGLLEGKLPAAVVDDKGRLVGVIGEKECIQALAAENSSLRDAEIDLKAIMDSAEDLMCISDGSGAKLRISPSAEKLYGTAAQELVGKNVRDLERNGIYFPSATRLAIEKKARVTVTQVTKSDRKLMVTANPIINGAGEIVRVVSISKDITDLHQLEQELENTKEMMEKYEKELSELRKVNLDDYEIIGNSKAMQGLLQLATKVAAVDSTVLILGESGVGKELVAKLIHGESKRRDGPFIKINCGAIPETLLESELFGYDKGAFTGANREGKPGLMELAHKGTLFLDEIAELPLNLQVKLLRVLQEQEIVRVGGVKPIKVDIRIITATNRDIEQMVEEGTFRRDLYYRLNVVPIPVPPLRERREDIPALVHHFLQRFSQKYSRSRQITPEAMELLFNYSWPGNVRELENIIERIVVTSDSSQITVDDLPAELQHGDRKTKKVVVNGIIPLKMATEAVEEQLIRRAMERYKSTYKAARALGINQSTVVRKVQKYLKNGTG
ncbi:MAG: sigma 54-interacting transcriptional regulator [bacterium]|nr:sigma 54-interacting transcriptional regulator [Bacillota bacterium]